jgi:hypothetical protein
MREKYSQLAVILDRELDISRRTALVERLHRIYGVVEARFDPRDHRSITVFYRDGTLGPATLLDFLSRQNAPASLVPCDEAIANDVASQHFDASAVGSK